MATQINTIYFNSLFIDKATIQMKRLTLDSNKENNLRNSKSNKRSSRGKNNSNLEAISKNTKQNRNSSPQNSSVRDQLSNKIEITIGNLETYAEQNKPVLRNYQKEYKEMSEWILNYF